MVMNKLIPFCAFAVLLLSACDLNSKYPKEIEGYAPIYVDANEQFSIQTLDSQPYQYPGKIYKYGNYSFQLDKGTGIHVINSSNPAAPVKIKFIKLAGCTEISIKDNMLFTNNFSDLLSLNISDINNVTLAKRISDVFPASLDTAPPDGNVYFECIDNSKGLVIGWEKKIITNPKCYKQ